MGPNQNINILHDLEISTDGIMEDISRFRSFKNDIFKAAEELETILNSRETVGSIEDSVRSEFRSNPEFRKNVKEQFGPILAEIYNVCEELPLPEVFGLVYELKSFVESLENLIHDRAKSQAVSATDTMQNKKLAQIQHKRLREQWDTLRRFAKMWYGEDFPAIKAKPGNYGATSSFRTYAYQLPGENTEVLYNFIAVAKLLGIYYEDMTFQVFMDYCLAHPDEVSVTELIL